MEVKVGWVEERGSVSARIELVKQLDSTAELRALLDELFPPQLPPLPVPPPAPPPAPQPPREAYMEVGRTTAKPGTLARVEIRGSSGGAAVDGFAIAVGIGRRVKQVDFELGEFLANYLGETKTFVTQIFATGHPEPFWNAYLGFFSVNPQGVTGLKDPIVIPFDTLLMTAVYHVPPDHPPLEQLLFSQSNWFSKTGRPPRVAIMYTNPNFPSGIPVNPEEGRIIVEAS